MATDREHIAALEARVAELEGQLAGSRRHRRPLGRRGVVVLVTSLLILFSGMGVLFYFLFSSSVEGRVLVTLPDGVRIESHELGCRAGTGWVPPFLGVELVPTVASGTRIRVQGSYAKGGSVLVLDAQDRVLATFPAGACPELTWSTDTTSTRINGVRALDATLSGRCTTAGATLEAEVVAKTCH